MDDKRKQIIVNEIKMWKETKMIPQEYCDFLLAIYTEGNEANTRKQNGAGKSVKKQAAVSVFILALIAIAVFVIYFTELHFILQTMILTAFVGCLLFLGIHYANKEIFYPVFFVGAAIILLLLSVFLNEKVFGNHRYTLYLLLFVNCGLWLIAGKAYKLLYFTLSGFLGLVILLVSIVI
ncbi:hypothetical protein QQ991_12015 [Weizmannia coagulans]|uniref:DUF2157 domain-containing protein n=2 Tax=Heyndrickxia TaxID=2837504 RepID=A0AAN0WBB7_HEYCO|nr:MULTISPECIES: hypothetical protein [Heyndrickxia]AJO22575.1 hypothetical protein SB48_HM08orf02816 [Heyndrickxia coagulans]AKN55901.1 hypothetical protein AB434_3496 [Heyndrickxia coagulans]ATW82870.1 hypothetical protein CIW84_07755 [Heyndrickxia coagulans]KGB28641.1 hypothetical protein IE89_15785 [Heyndrickxia coagulans]KGT40105.1 hypothetical protein P421_00520 [Heyndrickxia coagulans P38]